MPTSLRAKTACIAASGFCRLVYYVVIVFLQGTTTQACRQDTARSDGGHVTVDESSAAQVFGAASQETSQSIEASTAAATPDHVSISLPIASSETTSKESGHRVAKAVAPTDFSNVAEVILTAPIDSMTSL